MLLVLLLATAQAHRPHTVVSAYTVSPDHASTGRAWLVMDPHDISQLMRSEDFGLHWDFVGGAPTADSLIDLAYAGDTLLALSAEAGLWWSPDEGERWEFTWLAEDATAHTMDSNGDNGLGPRVAIGTSAGVYTVDEADPGSPTQVLAGVDARHVAWGSDSQTLLVVTAQGDLLRSPDGGQSWEPELPRLPAGVTGLALIADETGTFAGTTQGVYRLDGSTWQDCAALPTLPTLSHGEEVPRLEANRDGRLLLTTGAQALVVSTDRCDSWTLLDSGLVVPYGGMGNATSASEAWVGLSWVGHHVVAAGFSGLVVSDDGGRRFSEARLLGADYSRGVAVHPRWPDERRVFIGGYGGGVWWTDDGGRTFEGSSLGISAFTAAYDLMPAPDFANSERLFYAGLEDILVSDDGGLSFAELEVGEAVDPIPTLRSFVQSGGAVWALGQQADPEMQGRLAWSEDGGDTWSADPTLEAQMGGSLPRDVAVGVLNGVPVRAVAMDAPAGVITSLDGGAWRWAYEVRDTTSAGVALWPRASAGQRLVLGLASEGVLLSEDGELWTAPETPPDAAPRVLVQADDGTLLLVTRDGQLYRSDDGGLRWAPVGEPFPAAVYDLVPAPGFGTEHWVLFGTTAGVFWSEDGGESVHPLPRYERLEAGSVFLSCREGDDPLEPECPSYTDRGQGAGGGWELTQALGHTLRFTFHGHTLQVHGPTRRDPPYTVWVDGAELATVTPDGEPWTSEALDPGWHDVVITPADEGTLSLDWIAVWGPGEPMPLGDPPHDPEPGCRCRENHPSAGVLLPLLWGLTRRGRAAQQPC